MAGDNAVARHNLVLHAEIAAAMRDQLVDFFERAVIEQEVDPLAGGELAAVVLALLSVGAAAQFSAAFEVGESVVGICQG